MSNWVKVGDGQPIDGEMVEVKLPGGKETTVEFFNGRFWKVRQGNGGQAYSVVAWRSIEKPKQRRDSGDTKSED